ncbi:DUF5076 domain-containing protein [uncultured Rhodoblastus sp.]|uniref:DUF5076 domain-containing protein n=1 Tax=uncultured Rhodoblastus sp. TaxID=543037 RepID=UPI0025EF0DB6|nr:DUF5076 domain-containing protein [uncultured Rhodoblastus sp.]
MTETTRTVQQKRELAAPPDVEANGGTEILRLFITGESLSLTVQRGFANPEVWGQVLARLARHISTVYDRETPIGEARALAVIVASFDAALNRKALDPGATQ